MNSRNLTSVQCSICQRKPDFVRVDRYHALRCWVVTVRCHGQVETMTIKPPPLSDGAPFVLGDTEVW